MRRLTVIPLIAIVSAYLLTGCTMLPASQETGVGPEEYAGIKNTEAVKKENEELKSELDRIKDEVKKMESDYLDIAKNNENLLIKLEEAESKLDILENEGIPKFKSEKTDKNSIVAYLNNNKQVLEERLKGIEIIDSLDENNVLFYTIGYGDSLNQMFLWPSGESEPIVIDKADFDKEGKLTWIDSRFLEINAGSEQYKILDTKDKSIISSFFSKHDAYLIPETSSYIIQRQDDGAFVVYDFLNSREQDINIDYKGKLTEFEINGDSIVFKGSYSDEYETQYSVNASINVDRFKEKYNVLSLVEAIKIKENEVTRESMETVESTDEGTV